MRWWEKGISDGRTGEGRREGEMRWGRGRGKIRKRRGGEEREGKGVGVDPTKFGEGESTRPDCRLGNANPGDIFQTRVYGFGGLQTRVPGYPGLM